MVNSIYFRNRIKNIAKNIPTKVTETWQALLISPVDGLSLLQTPLHILYSSPTPGYPSLHLLSISSNSVERNIFKKDIYAMYNFF